MRHFWSRPTKRARPEPVVAVPARNAADESYRLIQTPERTSIAVGRRGAVVFALGLVLFAARGLLFPRIVAWTASALALTIVAMKVGRARSAGSSDSPPPPPPVDPEARARREAAARNAPTTPPTLDEATASLDAAGVITLALRMLSDERPHLAGALIRVVDAAAGSSDDASPRFATLAAAAAARDPAGWERAAARAALSKRDPILLARARARHDAVEAARREIEGREGGETAWTLSHTDKEGTRTSFKHAPARPGEAKLALWVKVDGRIRGADVVACAAVWKEADLFRHWFAPVCPASSLVGAVGEHGELVCHLQFGDGPLTRDFVVHGLGDFSEVERGEVVILGASVPDEQRAAGRPLPLDGEALPAGCAVPPPPVRGYVTDARRGAIHAMQVLVRDEGPERGVRNVVVLSLDLKLALVPQWLLDAILRGVVGVMLALMGVAARKVAAGPDASVHAKRILTVHSFYRDWLIPRVRHLLPPDSWTARQFPAS